MFLCIKEYKNLTENIKVGEVCFLLFDDFNIYLVHKGKPIPISEDELDECFRKI